MKIKRERMAKAADDDPPMPAEIPFEEEGWCGCVIGGVHVGAQKRDERIIRYCGTIHPDPRVVKTRLKVRRRRDK